MGTMDVKRSGTGNQIQLTFTGKIDEDADFSKIDIVGAEAVTIDLDGVQTINSCGIREWIKWIRTAPTGASIVYEKCPKVIVDQINMVEGFLPANGRVQSFYVPYFNEDSGAEKSVLFTAGQHFGGGSLKLPGDIKDDSGNVMEIDVIESKYFKFIEKMK